MSQKLVLQLDDSQRSDLFLTVSAYCDAGMELMGDTCKMCSWGFYKNNSGSHAALFDNCTECSAGWTTLSLGSTSSDNCSIRKCFLPTRIKDLLFSSLYSTDQRIVQTNYFTHVLFKEINFFIVIFSESLP